MNTGSLTEVCYEDYPHHHHRTMEPCVMFMCSLGIPPCHGIEDRMPIEAFGLPGD